MFEAKSPLQPRSRMFEAGHVIEDPRVEDPGLPAARTTPLAVRGPISKGLLLGITEVIKRKIPGKMRKLLGFWGSMRLYGGYDGNLTNEKAAECGVKWCLQWYIMGKSINRDIMEYSNGIIWDISYK